ncbi:4a-hydroxytetrahydrobiopterin dehydratase [Atopomonas sediminilitoris]|uniref:4a-hydroxytetrahydrobiopterin dehydratase n=1 Tax=Atopomonas sediminilitoris TaxID=2919919 RepID=UPI001F4D5373|nr:4a-hydroxytetrahydrobiopterin dehydratase [Atopomonas sediminilitoris]MCJ8168361.1 4a-hydroxytetrahydrobiopterin dehydratase [Atopomonas sediminilitoris]
MSALHQADCQSCDSSLPAMRGQEAADLLREVPDWSIIERHGVLQLERRFVFKNFAQALAFTQHVGELAEAANHHPTLLTEWGQVTVTWWTHSLKGLHRNDFIMAAKTSKLACRTGK